MKVLLCPEYFFPHIGGNEVWCWNVAKGLAKKNHEVHVLTYKHKRYMRDEIREKVHIHRMGFFPIEGIQPYFKRALVQGIGIVINGLKMNYDLLIATQTFPLLPCYFISKLRKKPIVAVFHDVFGFRFSIADKGIIKGLIRAAVEYIALKLSYDAIVTVSNSTKQKLIKYQVPERKIHVVYGGVDMNLISSVSGEKGNNPSIIYLGRLVKHKKIEILILIFKKIIKKVPNAKLYIVGTGPQENFLRDLSRKLNIEEKVIFTGYLSEKEKIRLLKKANILVLPSIMEGFGLVLVEAMACGTPVITINLGGVSEVVVDGKTGYLVKPYNVRELEEKVLELVLNRDKTIEMGLNGIKLVKDKFTWEKVVLRLERVFYKVCNAIKERNM